MKVNIPTHYRYLLLIVGFLTSNCAAHRPASTPILASTSAPDSYYENAKKNVAPAAVAIVSKEATYGVTAQNPIKVGGGINGEVRGEQSYLNALRGPAGQPITYRRQGSCCPFKTPNGLIDNTGMLDAYTVTWEGNAKPLALYINMYDKDDLFIPMGLTAIQ